MTVPLFLHYGNNRKAWVCEIHDGTFETISEALNAYGSMGWELVGVIGNRAIDHERYRACFKAPA